MIQEDYKVVKSCIEVKIYKDFNTTERNRGQGRGGYRGRRSIMGGYAEQRQIRPIQEEQGEENRAGRIASGEDSETQHRYERKREGTEEGAVGGKAIIISEREGELETQDRKERE